MVFATALLALATAGYVAWVTWKINTNAIGLTNVNAHLDAIDAWIDSRRDASPSDVLRSEQVAHLEVMTWLRSHAVGCEPCPPCQTGDADEVPGS